MYLSCHLWWTENYQNREINDVMENKYTADIITEYYSPMKGQVCKCQQCITFT